ncbi:MAG: hypothetical protein HY885_03800 [Deltaproteobacteria bacterium]|nr:hypothetical protein [Deltaproteobacteria bacterium]
MIAHKKEFGGGLLMMAGFWAVFAIIMSPVFAGQNLLDYMDSLYNSISKNSAYYIPSMKTKAEKFNGNEISIKIKSGDKASSARIANLLAASGATVQEGDGELRMSGDLGTILANVLADADAMFANNGEAVKAKYGADGKQTLYDWSKAMEAMEKPLNKQEKFNESKILYQVRTKSIEPAYNYFGIQAQSIKEKAVVVVLSLVGYVIYTMWFGFSILFMFEGWGLKLEH